MNLPRTQLALLKIEAHEVRVLSTAFAYLNEIPVEEILRAAFWSNQSVFAKFCLRNVTN